MVRRWQVEQNGTTTEYLARRCLHWIELDCPRCHRRSYVPERRHKLARTGSQREYARCAWCGEKLTSGRIATYPKERTILRFLPDVERGGGRTEVLVNTLREEE